MSDFLLLVGNTDLGQTLLILTICGALLYVGVTIGVPMVIYIANDIDSFQSNKSFKYLIGGFVLVLTFAVPATLGYDIYIISSLANTIQSQWIRSLSVAGRSTLVLYSFTAGFFLPV